MGKLKLDQFNALRFRSQAGQRGLGDAKDPVQDHGGRRAVSEMELAFETPHQAQTRSSTIKSHCIEAVAGEANEYREQSKQAEENDSSATEEKE